MDYLDARKQFRRNAMLFIGYILIAIAITIATIVLLYQSYGFGLGKNGTVIQNGLTFFSSHPTPARIYINGNLNSSTTNSRLALPEGVYKVTLARTGYDDWQRTIGLQGGSVLHYDYPFLFPKSLTTNKIQAFDEAPVLATQSPDRRWLIVNRAGSLATFDVRDLKNPTKPLTTIALPAGLLSKATTSESLQLSEWADDNTHVLLQHNFDGKTEFILLNRTNPDQSVNLNSTLGVNPTKITLKNKKFDQYYLYDSSTGSLQSASLQTASSQAILQHVLAYQSYGNDTILYVTDAGAPSGKALVKMLVGTKTSTLRSFPASPTYVVDLTQYSGTMYVAVGASSSNKVYVYQDPLSQLAKLPDQAPVPAQVLYVSQPNYLSFSDNAQFIVAENGSHFGVYDLENQKGYIYDSHSAPDSPMPHAAWMDGDRLYYIRNGKLDVFDYDHTNEHLLAPASANFLAAFAPDYKYVYTISPNASGQYELTQTWLLAPGDR